MRRRAEKPSGGSSNQKPIDPLRALARASSDPLKRELLILLADLSALAREALRRLIREFAEPTEAGPPRDLPPEPLRLVLQLIDRIHRLVRDLITLWRPRI
jgi:hypothetical protein